MISLNWMLPWQMTETARRWNWVEYIGLERLTVDGQSEFLCLHVKSNTLIWERKWL